LTWISSYHKALSKSTPALTPAATPVITPAGGTYTSAKSVSIGSATAGSSVYYTVNGETPTTASTLYSGPITVSTTQTVKAIAIASGFSTSAVASASFTINSGTRSNIVGVNFAAGGESALSYENFPIYKNRIRESRGFTVASNISVWCALTNAGWPAVDFSVVVWEGSIVPAWLTAGTFKCGFIGTGSETIGIPSGVTGTVSNVVHGTGGAYTTFDFTASSTCGFMVTGTTGGVTNVFCYLPEYPAATIDNPVSASAFTTESIAHYSQFRHIRWMQHSNALNNSQQATSTTRRSASNTQCQQGWNGAQSIAISSGITANATSGYLDNPWPYPSGYYSLTFEEASYEARLCQMTQGQTFFQWTRGLTATPTSLYVLMSTEGYPIDWQVAFCAACGVGGWFNFPIYEDGPNGSAGSYTAAALQVIAAGMPAGAPIMIEIGNENWNFDYVTRYTLIQLALQYGFASATQYLGYRLHQLATACRSQFGANFGKGQQVGLVLAWQQTVGGLGGIYDALSYMASTYGNPSNDAQFLAAAPYVTPTVGNGDSIATIQADVAAYTVASTAGQTGPKNENYAVMALNYGLQLVCYESGGQWNAVNSANPNVGLAILDSGMTPAMEAYYNTVVNQGYTLITHFTAGVAGTGGNLSPTNEFTNNYSALSSAPTLLALQSFIANGVTFTRNVVSGSGSVIAGANFADNVSGSPTLGYVGAYQTSPNLYTNGYIPYLINCTAPGTYSVTLNTSNGDGAALTNVNVNGTILYTGVTVNSGNTTLGNVTLNAGQNFIMIGNGTQSAQNQASTINSLTFH
jgi:hypothetical protein